MIFETFGSALVPAKLLGSGSPHCPKRLGSRWHEVTVRSVTTVGWRDRNVMRLGIRVCVHWSILVSVNGKGGKNRKIWGRGGGTG